MHQLKFLDSIRLRGDIHVAKWRLEDPNDPWQREMALRISPHDAHGGLWVPDGEAEGTNLMLNSGINEIWRLVCGASSSTFTNAQAQIGIGDSTTAAAAGQTDLQAATNKLYKAMDATFPTSGSSQQAVFRSTFGTTEANYAWQEFVVRHGTTLICLDRGVTSMGTKTSAGTWTPTVTITFA